MKLDRVFSWLPLIWNFELSVLPAPVTRLYTGDVTVVSATPRFPTVVPLGRFSATLLFVGFSVLTGSLSFFLGNAASLSEQWRNAMITFSTYPAILFEGAVKLLLFTLIPAGFVSYLPIQALRSE